MEISHIIQKSFLNLLGQVYFEDNYQTCHQDFTADDIINLQLNFSDNTPLTLPPYHHPMLWLFLTHIGLYKHFATYLLNPVPLPYDRNIKSFQS